MAGKWIMLRSKLPIQKSPAKLSIFWAEERPDEEAAYRQFKRYNGEYCLDGDDPDFFNDEHGKKLSEDMIKAKAVAAMATCGVDSFYDGRGNDPNVMCRVSFLYKGTEIFAYPHEYSILTHANMTDYIRESHELVPGEVVSSFESETIFDNVLREIYDAARVDGADHGVALAMAFGVDVSEKSETTGLATFPKVGWYRCKLGYANMFCHDWEMVDG